MFTTGIRNELEENDDLSKEEIFDVLSNRRRRFVIHALKRENREMSVSDLSTYVTAWEVGVEPQDVKYDDRRHVYSTLQRTHLPKLAEKNIVIYDKEENVVNPTPQLKEVDIYTEIIGRREIPWGLYYFGLASICGVLLLMIIFDVSAFETLTPYDVGVFITISFGVSSAAHYYIGRRTRLGNTKKPPERRNIDRYEDN